MLFFFKCWIETYVFIIIVDNIIINDIVTKVF